MIEKTIHRLMRGSQICQAQFLLVLILGLTCGCGRTEDSREHTGAQKPKLKVAVLVPLTGPAASGGVSSKEGFELAIDELRRVHGDIIDVSFEDTQSNPQTAVTIYRQIMTTKRPQVVIVELSSVTKAISPLLDDKSVLAVATAVAVPNIAAPDRFLYRVFPTSDGVAGAAAGYAISNGHRSASIVYVNDEYGVGSMNSFKQRFEEGGGNVVTSEPFSLLEKDFRTQWAKILQGNPPCLWITGYGPGYLAILNQLREQDYRGLIMTDWSLSAPDYFHATQGVRDGTIVVMPQCSPTLATRYREKYGKDGFMVNVGYSYDCLNMVWMAYADSSGALPDLATTFSATKNFKGAMGTISIQPSGDATAQYIVQKVERGQLVPLNK
jgi:branched-chain amino acid transport system substrate-binding protein